MKTVKSTNTHTIIPMEQSHVEQVAALHCRAIHSLLTGLGESCCRAFYRRVIRRHDCFGFVAVEGGRVCGFALGTLDHSMPFRDWRIRWRILGAMTVRPALWMRLRCHFGEDLAATPEVLYEGVDQACRRRGIATALTRALNAEFLARGATHYVIRIDRENLPNLARHQKLGARIVGEFSEDGIARYLLDRTLRFE